MNEKRRLIKNTGIIAIGNLSTRLVSFLLLPLYTTLLTTSEYGTVDYIVSIAAFIVPFSTMLMDESLFRFLIDCETDSDRKRVISQAMFLFAAGEVFFLAIAIALAAIIRNSNVIYLIFYVSGNAITVMMSAFLRGIGRTDQYAIFNFLQSLTRILLNILFVAIWRLGVSGLLISSILAMFSVTVIYSIKFKIWRYIQFKHVKKSNLIEMIRYSIPLIPNKVSWTIINLSDRIVIMNYLGSAFSGLYAIAYKFPNLMDTVYGFFYQSWKESSARVKGQSNQNEFYNGIFNYLKRLLFAVVMLMISFMPLCFKILINVQYHDALVYVPILLMGTFYENLSGFYGGIFTAYKDTKVMGSSTMAAAIINLAAHFALIRFLGLYAAAFSTIIASFVVCVYRAIKVKKYVKIKKTVVFDLCSYLILGVIVFCYYTANNYSFIVGMMSAICYAVSVNRRLIGEVIHSFSKKKQRLSKRK